MKVKIGRYINYWTTQRAEHVWYQWRYKKYDWEIENPDRLDKAVEFIFRLWHNTVNRLVNATWAKRKRSIKVKLDVWDDWSADHTLALIIHPLLKQLNEKKHGAPHVDDEDVPEHLRSTAAPAKENDWDTDENWFKRWDWIMNEMIWTFEQLASDDADSQFYHHEFGKDDKVPEGWVWISGFGLTSGFWVDRPGEESHDKRIQNGLRLFGRYYRGLWT